ncbi:hypothetical protein MKZ38_003335 [Zalerion maritima]|uniref:YAG7-like dimerisation domain-containing protein n=1 Tax=Zalerion maritima TaxID=339359 RepID=A0AAD5WQB7_9PEZI|nr:hypothetical protein MKZ38_003335 [Zalerion maritima]
MAAPATKNGAQAQASKKKKGKGERRTDSPAPSATAKTASVNPSESQEYENPYIKELAKNVRNCIKKLSNVAKTEALVEANKGKSLDNLVTANIINPDQKAQILNKPGLQEKLAEAEGQLNQYRKIHTEYLEQKAAEKKQLEESLADQVKKEVEEAKAAAGAEAKIKYDQCLLAVSQFLAVAAARRSEDHDPTMDENRALEGCLLQVYHGNQSGVDAMVKIAAGSSEKCTSVNGEELESTYADVKGIAAAYAAALYPPAAEAGATEDEKPAAEAAALADASDGPVEPNTTIVANASLVEGGEVPTEATEAPTNGHGEEPTVSVNGAPANASVANDAANTAAESQWDSPTNNESPINNPSLTQSWDVVPRDPAETDTGLSATPAAPTNTQSWSDEVAAHHETTAEMTDSRLFSVGILVNPVAMDIGVVAVEVVDAGMVSVVGVIVTIVAVAVAEWAVAARMLQHRRPGPRRTATTSATAHIDRTQQHPQDDPVAYSIVCTFL